MQLFEVLDIWTPGVDEAMYLGLSDQILEYTQPRMNLKAQDSLSVQLQLPWAHTMPAPVSVIPPVVSESESGRTVTVSTVPVAPAFKFELDSESDSGQVQAQSQDSDRTPAGNLKLASSSSVTVSVIITES